MSASATTMGLAERIRACDPQPRDAKTVARARAAIITAFGRTLSGAPSAIATALLATSGVATAGGSALVFGTDRRTSAIDAALVNATAAVAGSEASPDAAHAAFVVSLFGLCEERGKTGQEFLDALIAGAEISRSLPSAGRLEAALLGSAAAAARLLGLSCAKIAAALLMAGVAKDGTLAAGQGRAEALLVGQGLRNALLAALLAEAMDEASCEQMIEGGQRATGEALPGAEAPDLLALQSPPGAISGISSIITSAPSCRAMTSLRCSSGSRRSRR